MNLTDLSLLRGWLNHVDWAVLDEQLSEGEESALKRVRRLRRALAAKARFYGRDMEYDFWQGERSNTPSWLKEGLKSLETLNALPDPIPDLSQSVDQWFDQPVCAALPPAIVTLSQLAAWLDQVLAGTAQPSLKLKPHLKILLRFFDNHSPVLGLTVAKKPTLAALPVPLTDVAPLERVLVPDGLNGKHGENRSTEPCRIGADNDLAAINSWLALKDGNPKTYIAYKKELERVLLWALLVRGKALSTLNTDDCKAYVRFLQRLTSADSQWVAQGAAIKARGTWKPFIYRPDKNAPLSIKTNSEDADKPAPVLSPRSINYAKGVVSACMAWLVKQQYLKHNNFDGIPNVKHAKTRTQAHNRAFTLMQMQAVITYAESLADPKAPDFLNDRRTVFVLKFAFQSGLRLHELAAASYGDIETLEDGRGVHYFLKVFGKNSKERMVSMPLTFMTELKAYLTVRGLPTELGFLPQQAPLIPSLRDKTGRKHLTPAGIHKVLSSFFDRMFMHLDTDPQADPRFVAKLRQASTHWLRHSYGSYLANDKQVPLAYIRDEMGHTTISTTSIYLNADAKQRQQVVSAAFADM